jgi:hypothetical protein
MTQAALTQTMGLATDRRIKRSLIRRGSVIGRKAFVMLASPTRSQHDAQCDKTLAESRFRAADGVIGHLSMYGLS